jgi:flagellar protein FlaG
MEVLRAAVQPNPLEKAMEALSSTGVVDVSERKQTAPRVKESLKEENVKQAVDQANDLAAMFDRSLKFEYRKEADIYQVSVIDTAKDEVVRKIPPDEVVRFMENIKELFGAMLDVHA